MTMYVNPARLAVLYDGDERHIKGMAQDVVGQLAETAKNLHGRSLLIMDAHTMDAGGGVVNWSGFMRSEDLSQTNRQNASCYRTNNIVLDAVEPLALLNETLLTVDPLAPPPLRRFVPEKLDSVLILTGRDAASMGQEFGGTNEVQLERVLRGGKVPDKIKNPLTNAYAPLAFMPGAGRAHHGFTNQGTRLYSLSIQNQVAKIIQEALSAPTNGMSFHGTSGDVRQLVDAMAVTLADPEGARRRLAGNRFALLADHSKA